MAGSQTSTSVPAGQDRATPLAARAAIVAACGLLAPVIAEIVIRSPPTRRSRGKAAGSVVQTPLASVLARDRDNPAAVRAAASVDPSAGARWSPSAVATSHGDAGCTLSVARHARRPRYVSVAP